MRRQFPSWPGGIRVTFPPSDAAHRRLFLVAFPINPSFAITHKAVIAPNGALIAQTMPPQAVSVV